MQYLQEQWKSVRDVNRAGGFTPDSLYMVGLETRTAADAYRWDGMRRGGDPTQPFVIFQVTLEGEGRYDDETGSHLLKTGAAFMALVPGAHRYYLPATAPSWTFFWILIRHPYLVTRIAEQQRLRGKAAAILEINENSLLLARSATLLTGGFTDRFREEEALLSFLVAYDRHCTLAAESGNGGQERELLLESARRFVREHLYRPVEVTALAKQYAMSRSRFSHHFKAVTGTSPAHFMARVRLEEVSHRLVQTNAPLSRIAAETGFTDANHLCKVFRRHFRLSPGVFRQQMRSE